MRYLPALTVFFVCVTNINTAGAGPASAPAPGQKGSAAAPPTASGAGVKQISLARAHSMALARNPTLGNVDQTIRQADILINRAWAILLPNLSAEASITRNSTEAALDPTLFGAPAGTPPITIIDLWGKRLGFTANMALFNARSIPLIKNAYDNLERAKKEGKHNKNALLFVVSRFYYQVRSARKLEEVAEENLATAKEFARASKLRRQVGSATRIDELRAQLQVTTTEKNLANAKDAVLLAQIALGNLIGVKGAFECQDPPPQRADVSSLDSAIRQAMQQRMDLESIKIMRRMAVRDRLETWMKWVPSLEVTYKWTLDSAGGFSGSNDSWMLIFGARWSILEGGGRIAELSERKSKITMVENSIRQRVIDIRQEVQQGYLDLRRAVRNVGLAEKQVALAEETHKMVTKQYNNGMASSLDLLNAATELENRRVAVVVEKLTLDLALLSIRHVMGAGPVKS